MPDQALTAIASEVSEFLERHRACSKARPWASRCATLAEAWDSCTVPDWLIWARKQAGFEEKDVQPLRVWACWCVRQAVHLMSADASVQALETAERFVEGSASAEELAWAAEQAKPPGNASWPTPAEAWAAKAAAELAGLPAIAARAAAEALAWGSENRSAFAGVRLAQTNKLRELIQPQCKSG
jgi:hypothetical protein